MALPSESSLVQRLFEVQTEIATAEPDLSTLMDLIVQRSQDLTGSEGAAVELAEGVDTVYRAASGMARGQMGLRFHRDNGFSGLSADNQQAMICHDSEVDDRVDRDACRKVGLRSMVVQPLFHNNTVVGVVKVLSSAPGFFNHSATQILGSLARTVAGALVNAARWAEIESRNISLSHLASHDALTGIKNRAAFYDHLRQAVASAKRSHGLFAVALFDLDGLKDVNDTHGHQAGDFILRSFADRLSRRVRASDTVARLGGDEFAALLSPIDTPHPDLGRDLVRTVEGPVTFEGASISLRASAGLALFGDDGSDLEALVARADERLYEDKRSRRRA